MNAIIQPEPASAAPCSPTNGFLFPLNQAPGVTPSTACASSPVADPRQPPTVLTPGVYAVQRNDGVWQLAQQAQRHGSARLKAMDVKDIADEIMLLNGWSLDAQGHYPGINTNQPVLVDIAALTANSTPVEPISYLIEDTTVEMPNYTPGYTGTHTESRAQNKLNTNIGLGVVSVLTGPLWPLWGTIGAVNNLQPDKVYKKVTYDTQKQAWVTTNATQADLDAYTQPRSMTALNTGEPTTADYAKAIGFSLTAGYLLSKVPSALSWMKGKWNTLAKAADEAASGGSQLTAQMGSGPLIRVTEGFVWRMSAVADDGVSLLNVRYLEGSELMQPRDILLAVYKHIKDMNVLNAQYTSAAVDGMRVTWNATQNGTTIETSALIGQFQHNITLFVKRLPNNVFEIELAFL